MYSQYSSPTLCDIITEYARRRVKNDIASFCCATGAESKPPYTRCKAAKGGRWCLYIPYQYCSQETVVEVFSAHAPLTNSKRLMAHAQHSRRLLPILLLLSLFLLFLLLPLFLLPFLFLLFHVIDQAPPCAV